MQNFDHNSLPPNTHLTQKSRQIKCLGLAIGLSRDIIGIILLTFLVSIVWAMIMAPSKDISSLLLQIKNLWIFQFAQQYPLLSIPIFAGILLLIAFSWIATSILENKISKDASEKLAIGAFYGMRDMPRKPYDVWDDFRQRQKHLKQPRKPASSSNAFRNRQNLTDAKATDNQEVIRDWLLERIKEHITSDPEFQKQLKTLLDDSPGTEMKSMKLESNKEIQELYIRLHILENLLNKQTTDKIENTQSWKEWISTTNNIVGIIVALPAIGALIISIISLLHH